MSNTEDFAMIDGKVDFDANFFCDGECNEEDGMLAIQVKLEG